jgi:nicotinamide-nucleotide amidase
VTEPPSGVAGRLVAALRDRGQTLAVAESLTGGLVSSGVIDVPGASDVMRGGVVAYATDLKHRLLGVDAGLLDARGAVDAEVAAQMARGVRDRLRATWGVATTGAAGPDPQDGAPPGTVFVAVDGPGGPRVRAALLPGSRQAVRAAAAELALAEAVAAVEGLADGAGGDPEHPPPVGS